MSSRRSFCVKSQSIGQDRSESPFGKNWRSGGTAFVEEAGEYDSWGDEVSISRGRGDRPDTTL